MPENINAVADESQLRTLDRGAEERMITYIDEIKRAGNTLGGICEVVADGLPVGMQILGKHFDEAGVLRVAHAYQQTSNWHLQRPHLVENKA